MSQPSTDVALSYLEQAEAILHRVRDTQLDAIREAAGWCSEAILQGGLVHLFGSGHSAHGGRGGLPALRQFPRLFTHIVELSLTNHTQVVGANGQRKRCGSSGKKGFAEPILSNFVFRDYDVMMVFSTSGNKGVVIDMAHGAKRRGMKVVAVLAAEYSKVLESEHSSGKKLADIADLVIDNCALPGDSMVAVPGVDVKVGPRFDDW